MNFTQAVQGHLTLTPFYGVQGYTAVILAAAASHVFFKLLEPRSPSVILSVLVGTPTALAVLLSHSHSKVLLPASISYPLYFVTLMASVVAYRLSPFHPLARFPGPIMGKITRLWALYIVYTGDQHLYHQSLHKKYGAHVRTGPNHLSVCDVGAVPTVLGHRGFPKGSRYDVTKHSLKKSEGSLFTLSEGRDQARRQRRRMWDHGLNISAVQGYQDMLETRISQLIAAIQTRQELDLSMWMSYFSFDFMGDLAFGGSFRLMEQGSDSDGYMTLSHVVAKSQEMVGAMPWINPFIKMIFGSNRGIRGYYKFATESVLARKAQIATRKDLFYYLLDEEGTSPHPLSLPTLISESALVISAGAETTGVTLATLFFSLVSNPDVLIRLREEIDLAFPAGSDKFDAKTLAEMKYLNAVINETLRMWPAVPNGVQRRIPLDSPTAVIAGCAVPSGTTVQVPTFCVHRDSRYFSPDPDSFRPDRWLNEPVYKTDHAAFFPFSYGPMNCVGKSLAIQELRMVTCALVRKFEFRFAPGWDKGEWEMNLRDAFIFLKGRMPVVVTERA